VVANVRSGPRCRSDATCARAPQRWIPTLRYLASNRRSERVEVLEMSQKGTFGERIRGRTEATACCAGCHDFVVRSPQTVLARSGFQSRRCPFSVSDAEFQHPDFCILKENLTLTFARKG
jgi:hypothetical protein